MSELVEQLRWIDAVGTAELVSTREITRAEATEAAIERIEAGNAAFNAVIHPRFDRAHQEAERADGPLAGAPMLVKDALCQLDDEPLHLGMAALARRGFRATGDSVLAQRYRRAGLAILGRTNLPELASSATTEPLAYGPTRNPWSRDHSPGGSSGGSAAAVAAGFVPVAHGNDMGGSIRVPAAHCGLVGLKPTRGRTSLAPQFGEYWGPLTHEHVLTRTVRDSATILDLTAGAEPGDPCPAPPPRRPWALDVAGADSAPLRIGLLSTRFDGSAVHPDCLGAVELAARSLEALGHHVEPGFPDALADQSIMGAFGILTSVHLASEIERLEAALGETIGLDELEPGNQRMVESGLAVTGVAVFAARAAMVAYARRVLAWWAQGWDLLLTPTTAAPPALLGQFGPLAADPVAGGILDHVAFTPAFDITGQPAISLPLQQSPAGFPIGVQLVAATGREDQLFAVAAQLEAAHPWQNRHPVMP